ncbi:hypothetical protein GE107_08110 [Cohnella sp. CFH 77786]|uniref:hypothetical protein n=1 Tax=Cohnella sp. CFH 77786 TaxID=2662265 RepID=UPI001C60C43B|nr:hypothetical protein [Cohnella sp. CFH 77786]MBW5446023.1 hypothetical protein [Cohnella sp. CFH 77786]
MKEPNPEWYRGLRNEPLVRRTFTMDNIMKIEEKVAKMERERVRAGGRGRRAALGIAVFAVVLAAGIAVYAGNRPDDGQTRSLYPDISSPSAVQPEPSQAMRWGEGPYSLKSEVEVLEKPEAYGGSVPVLFVAPPGSFYFVKEKQGDFVYVVNPLMSSIPSEGWIPKWYLTEDDKDRAEKVEPYEMIVKTPVAFRMYPGEPKPSGFELEPGKVLQVTARYGEWMRVNIVTYDSPYAGDKWVPASALEAWDPAKAKEGFLKPGATVYREDGQTIDAPPALEPIWIQGEVGGRYQFHAPGGYIGYVDKKDFIPNPFAYKVIDQSGEQPADPKWLMSEEEKQAYQEYAEKKSDELLKGKRPLEIFRYYVEANREGDYGTVHALYAQGHEFATPDLETFLKDVENDPEGRERSRQQWETYQKRYRLEEQIKSDSAWVVMSDGSKDPESVKHFGLTLNKDGVWKVNWLPMQ